MAKIYISSTYTDLVEYREAAYRTLRRMKHDVIAMEDYVATDQRPLSKCLDDVAACGLYIGIFAWRYGYIPGADNPDCRSITELEYRKAGEKGIPRLIFLLDEEQPWQRSSMDSVTGDGDGGARIAALRQELKAEHMVSFFTTPDQLASSVGVAAALELASMSKAAISLALPEEISETISPVPVRSSLVPEIGERVRRAIREAETAKLLAVNLGHGESWWSTRLYLLSALAADYTQIRQIVFMGSKDRFIGMASPAATRLALADSYPDLERVYRDSIPEPGQDFDSTQDKAAVVLQSFVWGVGNLALGGEAELKVWVTQELLERWLKRQLTSASVEASDQTVTALLLYRIIDREAPYVALVENGELVRVVDRQALADRIARDALEQALQ